MKRALLLLSLLALLLMGSTMVMGQGIIIAAPTATPENPDRDGDGIANSRDSCPDEAGPQINNGCPVQLVPLAPQNPPNNPPGSDVPPPPAPVDPNVPAVTTTPRPFVPPMLPGDGCYITPLRGEQRVNVREVPSMAGDVIGSLLPGTIYEAEFYVMDGADVWFQVLDYAGSLGAAGYVARPVVAYTDCPPQPTVFVRTDVAQRIIAEAGGLEVVDPTASDCDEDGVPDLIQYPMPPCAYDFTIGIDTDTQQDPDPDVNWWFDWLPLMCGDMIPYMDIIEMEDGTQYVEDAGCR